MPNLTTNQLVTSIKNELKAKAAKKADLENGSIIPALANNLEGDTIVDAEFYKRKTGGTQSVGSGIAAIKEVRGKSLVWNQLAKNDSLVSTTFITVTINAGYRRFTYNSGSGQYSNYFLASNVTSVGHILYVHFRYNTPTNIIASIQAVIYGNPIALNIATSGWKDISRIYTCQSITNTQRRIYLNYNADDVGKYIDISPFIVIDLTLMFGAGKEPATVAEFEKMFPLDYYDYNAGEIIPFAAQNLVTTGKNQYNPATGKANLLGGQTYQISGTYTSAEIDGVAVTLDSNNCFTTTKDCVLDIVGGNDTDTIVALYNGENVSYEPYEKHTLPLDPSQWRDKQGNLVFPYSGMHGVGTAYDYAKVDTDGYIRRAVRCFGQVYLGSLDWSYIDGDTSQNVKYFSSNTISDAKYINSTSIVANIVNAIYQTTDGATIYYGRGNKIIAQYTKLVRVLNSSYTDAATFKTAMQDVPLIYELAEPVEVELATPVYAKYLVDKDGTEEITPANGTKPYTTMANLSILYAMDARGEIKNLPKNYLSKESAENMLNAMVSAGVIASYTMTYDAANAMYQFTIVAPVQSDE